MSSLSSLIARKVARLVDVIDDLRGQVRVAFATELTKAISTTVRDVLSSVLGGKPASEWQDGYDGYGPGRHGTDDGWDDPYRPSASFDDLDDEDEEDARQPFEGRRSAKGTISASAITLAVATGSWLYRHSRSKLCGVTGTLLVGVVAVFGGPLVRSVVTVAAAVNQLTGAGDHFVPPLD